ncbi:MAG: hypothetical protein LBD30_05125, partial [Verrucomicrobiales bacterium]|nr:hypothetical protein [Verrucomicrobiales bacterium]
MKKFALLLGAALALGGCARERSISVDEPVPPVTEVDNQAAVSESELQSGGQTPPADVDNTAVQPKPWVQPAPAAQAAGQSKYPVAKSTANRPGIVRSPYAPYAGDVD